MNSETGEAPTMRELSDDEIINPGDYWKNQADGETGQIPNDKFSERFLFGNKVSLLFAIDPFTIYLRPTEDVQRSHKQE